MASKTHVDGNRVTIDEIVYHVRPAGAGRWGVADEFGGQLGYFTFAGSVIKPDDFGKEGAPPVSQIARLWATVNLHKDDKAAAPTSPGICRVETFEGPTQA